MKKIIPLLALLMVVGINTAIAEDTDIQKLEQTLAQNPDDFASLITLIGIYVEEGKFDQAIPLYQKWLAENPDDEINLTNLAEIYRKQGKYEQAEPLYQQALTIDEKDKNNPDIAIDLNNLAILYQMQGRYDQAESLYKRSLAIIEKILKKKAKNDSNFDRILNVGIKLNNLATLYDEQGKYEQAEPLYKRSLAIREKTLAKEGKNADFSRRMDVATSLNNLALHYGEQGKYGQARLLFQRSLAIGEDSPFGRDRPDVALSLNNLAWLYKNQGKYKQAESSYQRSLAIYEKALGKDHPDVAMSLNNLAKLYSAQGKYSEAAPLLQRSLRLTNQTLERWLWGAGEKTRQSYLKKQEASRNVYLTFYTLQNTPDEAFYFSLSRKGLLLRIASEMGSLAKQSTDPEIQKNVQKFNDLRTRLANLAFSGKVDKKAIQDLEDESNKQERELSQLVSSFKRSKTEVTTEEVLEKLGNEQAVIDFLVYTEFDFKTQKPKTDQVIALIANKKDHIKLIKLGELAPIAEAIKTYQAAIVPNKDNADSREKTLKQNAQTLYNQLWQPLTPYLQNKKTVYLIPDGVLHLLPFKALQDKDGHYLAESMQLITLSSARDIVLPPLTGKARTAAIFAAPDYGEVKTSADNTTRGIELKNIYFQPLASALQEGQQIQKLFFKKQPDSPAKLLMKKEATEQAVTASTSPKILHLATHGFFLEDSKPDEKALTHGLMRGLEQDLPLGKIDNPLTHSGLAFAGANLGVQGIKQADKTTDGILTALEVLNLNLEGTDLVTLSACDTGKGDVKIGEGVYSLNRAFQEAGAKAVLSTLWSVDDQATEKFMQAFYNRFLDGKPAQQAIQETQNEFMQDKQYSNPFYWAGFVMMGKE